MAYDATFAQDLKRLVGRVRWHLFAHGLLRFGVLAGAAILAAVWAAGGPVEPQGVIAWGLSLSLVGVLASLAWTRLLRPLWKVRNVRDLVAHIETEGGFENVLVAAEEARRLPGRWASDDPVQAELRRRLDARAVQVLSLLTPDQVHPRQQTRVWLALLVCVALGSMLAVRTAPGPWGQGLARIVSPATPEVVLPTIGMYGLDDPSYVVSGEAAALGALDFAGGEGAAVCEIRTGTGLWQALETRPEPLDGTYGTLVPPYRKWTAQVDQVREDFAFRFRRGSLVSPVREVLVRQHPLVTRLAGTVKPPAYTRLPVRDLARIPAWFEVPAGSLLRLEGQVNHSVARGMLVASSGDTLLLATDSHSVSAELRIDRTVEFRLVLEDSFGLRNQSPLVYEVSAAADETPAVRLERPNDDGILPINGELTLQVEAADDFGLSGLRLLFRTLARDGQALSDGGPGAWQGLAFWPANEGGWLTTATISGPVRLKSTRTDDALSNLRARFRLEIDAGAMDLVSGDVLEIVAEVRDNKKPEPRGVSRSRILRLILPSAADVLAKQMETSGERRSELEELQRRSSELDRDLDRLSRELMKNPLPDWARQKEMENTIGRQKTLQDELARVAQELQKELDNLARNQLTSEAQLEKAQEISELLSQSGSESLQELMEKMDDPSQQLASEEVAQAIREVSRNQQDMARKLDAALAMLKRMAQEQELEGLVALLEKMIQKQQELADISRKMDAMKADPPEGSEAGEQLAEGEKKDSEADTEAEEGEGKPAEGNEAGDQEADPKDSQAGQESGSESGENPEMPSEDELARRQEALAEELAQLQEKLEQALAELQEQNAGEEPSQADSQMEAALQEALQQLEEKNTQEKMSKASENMAQTDPGQTAQMQEEALRDLGALYHVMVQTQEAMQMAMKMEQVSSLRGLAADMLALSSRQEEIVALIPLQMRDMRDLDLTRRQHRLQKATIGVRNSLAALMEDAPNRILKLLQQVDNLVEEMGAAVQSMEDNRAPIARRHARASLSASNKMVIGLLTEAQMAGGSGGGSGSPMPSMSQDLQSMAEKQAGLNGSTEELRRMLANRGMSQESRAQMKRLGEEQAGLAGKMGDLAAEERERPEGERLLGDLGQLGRDMESVSRDLEDGLVNEETLIRQERILSRMLDARNSVRRRDYSSRRESRTAQGLFDQQDGVDGTAEDANRQPFRLEYQPLEKAPLEYRDLVRRYFSALDSLGRLDDGPLPEIDASGQGETP